MRICNNCGRMVTGGNRIELYKGNEYEGIIEYCDKCYDNLRTLLISQGENLRKRICVVDKKI